MKISLRLNIALAFLFVTVSLPSLCLAWSGKVVSVTDGDTIKVLHNGKEEKIRLYGIDTPEKKQSFGQKAQELTSVLVAGRNVEVQQKDIDRYGRIVGLVSVDGQSLNELIIQNGYAWVYRQYCKEKFCSDWIRSEGIARQQKKGMWMDSFVIPPWEWRAAQREDKQGASQSESTSPVIIIGEKPNTGSDESLLSKIGKALAPSNTPGGESPTNKMQYRCDGRTHCSQMTSCEEATFFLKNCSGTKMDGNNDGVPCERQWCH